MPRSSRRLVVLLCLLALLVGGREARGQDAGLAFLRIGPDAATLALGGVQAARAEGAYATAYNPAGLATDVGNSLAVSYHQWVADTRRYAAAARFRAGAKGGLGLAVTASGNGDLEARERPGDPDGTFDVQYVSAAAGYGRRFGPVQAGASVKFLSERIYTNSAAGYGVDLGLQARLLRGGLLLGAAVQHLGSMSELNAEASELPTTVRAGAAVAPLRIWAADDATPLLRTQLLAEVSYDVPDDDRRIHLGAAADVLDVLTVRLGYITGDALRGASFGAGVRTAGLRFDYALLPFESGFGGAGHVLTLVYGW